MARGVAKLGSDVKKFPPEVQAAYGREIDALRTKLDRVETAYDEMNQADGKQWEETHYRWGKSAAEYWQMFIASANRIYNEQKVPLEWARELADESMYQSAGWAESIGESSQGSQGWIVGIGERPQEPRGWAEGYGRLTKS